MPRQTMLFGEISSDLLRDEAREQFSALQATAGLFAAPAAAPVAITISKEALYAAAAFIAGFFAGQNPKLSDIAAKLDIVIQKIDQVLHEIRNLKYEVRAIVRDETTRLMNSELHASLIVFSNLLDASEQGKSMSKEQEEDVQDIRRKALFLSLTLWSYRQADGYAHWTALAAGASLYIASAKICGTSKQEMENNFNPIRNWLGEAVSSDVPSSFPTIAALLKQQADALAGQLNSQAGNWYLDVRDLPSPGGHGRDLMVYYVSVSGNADTGFVRSQVMWVHLLSVKKADLRWFQEGGTPEERANLLIATLASTRERYLQLRSAAPELDAVADMIRGMSARLEEAVVAY